jgi:hypothetical protein
MGSGALSGRLQRAERRLVGKDAAVAEFLALPPDVGFAWMAGEATDEQRARWPNAWRVHCDMWASLIRKHPE